MTNIVAQVPRLFLLEVARGAVPGYTSTGFLGSNPSVGSTFETVWDNGGNFTYPTSGETWEVVSDNTNDTSAGTGARTVLIRGLDDNYLEVNEAVSLDGTTPVVTTRTDWFRIYSVLVISSGSSQNNEGDVTVQVSGGGLIRSKIIATFSTTFNGLFTVPAGQTFFILSAQIFVPKNEDVTVRNKFLVFGTNTFVSGGDTDIYQSDAKAQFNSIPTFPEKTDIESRVKSSNTSVQVSLNVEGILANGTGLSLMPGGM
jgi:hypothetical protein